MHSLRALPAGLLSITVGVTGGLCFAIAGSGVSPVLATAAVGGLGIIFLLLRSPEIGLYILAAAVPVERFGRLTDDTAAFEISIMRILGMLAFATVVLEHLIRRQRPRITMPWLLWTGYVLFAIISLTYSSDVKGGVQIASGAFGNVLFLFTITSLVCAGGYEATVRRANTTIAIWLLSCLVIAAYSIYDWHFGSGAAGGIPIDSVDPQAGAQLAEYRWSTVWEDTAEQTLSGLSLRRSMGPTSHAAVFGINLLMSIPFFIYAIRRSRHWAMQALMVLGLAATVYCLFLTNTRSVLIIGGLLFGLAILSGLLRPRMWMMIGGMLAGVGTLAYLPPDIFNRILNSSNYAAENSEAIRVRLDYWEAGFRAILDNWAMGVGVGNRHVMLSYLRHPIEGQSTMHNIYLQTALDMGVPGWLCFMGFLVSVVLLTDRLCRRLKALGRMDEYWLAIAAKIMVVTVLAFGMQVDVFFFPLKAWWLILGIETALYLQLAGDERWCGTQPRQRLLLAHPGETRSFP